MSERMIQGGSLVGRFLVPNDGDYCRGPARERFNNLSFPLVSHALSLYDRVRPSARRWVHQVDRLMSVLAGICVSWLSVHHCSVPVTTLSYATQPFDLPSGGIMRVCHHGPPSD
jgi:hypothetical protein